MYGSVFSANRTLFFTTRCAAIEAARSIAAKNPDVLVFRAFVPVGKALKLEPLLGSSGKIQL
jgi:hypothetical protein